MNHLAHLFLAAESGESLVGNLAGDFVKGPLGERFSEGVRVGIREHRAIDAFTDAHPEVAAFRRVLIPEQGHWSRVIADVFFDHFLAIDFERWSAEPLRAFLTRRFAILDQHVDQMPERLAEVYPWMRDEGWLVSYASVEGIEDVLRRMSRRIARRPELWRAARHLVDSRDELRARFVTFFPEVIAFANALPSRR